MQRVPARLLQGEFHMSEFQEAFNRAVAKRDRIIMREGTADGERLKAYYLAHLIADELKQMEAERLLGV